jgi:hypothetical protein
VLRVNGSSLHVGITAAVSRWLADEVGRPVDPLGRSLLSRGVIREERLRIS